MSRWFLIDSRIVDSLEAATLSNKEYRRAFYDALDGAGPLARFVRGPYTRPHANEWRIIRERIFARDDFTCAYCGERGGQLECDHIVPVSRGGEHNDDNLTTACRSCNRAKRSKLVEEWIK